MKTKIYLLVIAFMFMNDQLKSQTYSFSYSTSAYANLVSPTLLVNNSSIVLGTVFTQVLGFNFNYWGTSYSSVNFSTYGYFNFGASNNYGFYPFYANLKGLGSSQIDYLLDASGGTGNRIFKIEWKNTGFINDATNSDVVSFQVWLFEGSNKVEYHFGPSTINSTHYLALFSNATGVFEAFDEPTGVHYYNLQGNPSMPILVANPSTNLFLTGYPPNGMVYSFIPSSATSIHEQFLSSDDFEIFPNPAPNKFYVKSIDMLLKSPVEYKVLDTSGQLVMKGVLDRNENNSVDLLNIKNGIYFLEIINDEHSFRRKFIHYSE